MCFLNLLHTHTHTHTEGARERGGEREREKKREDLHIWYIKGAFRFTHISAVIHNVYYRYKCTHMFETDRIFEVSTNDFIRYVCTINISYLIVK